MPEDSPRANFHPTQRELLPLPKGEGWGEGEGRVKYQGTQNFAFAPPEIRPIAIEFRRLSAIIPW